MKPLLLASILLLPAQAGMAASGSVDTLLTEYAQQGAASPSAVRGQQLWSKSHMPAGADKSRSCADCHTDQLTRSGKHLRTGKAIKPLAPSVNRQSLSDMKNIRKWFRRNCKWTLGRECNAREKADLLSFISQQ